LYAMFAELYTLYEQCKNNIDDDVETQVRKYVSEACKRKGVKFKAKKPTLQSLLVKYLFDDGITADCKRISSYVRVFTLVDVVSNFLSNTKEKSQQNQPLAFVVSNKLLTININKINNLNYLDYSHSIVAGGLLEIS
jgi:hypothetical protein